MKQKPEAEIEADNMFENAQPTAINMNKIKNNYKGYDWFLDYARIEIKGRRGGKVEMSKRQMKDSHIVGCRWGFDPYIIYLKTETFTKLSKLCSGDMSNPKRQPGRKELNKTIFNEHGTTDLESLILQMDLPIITVPKYPANLSNFFIGEFL